MADNDQPFEKCYETIEYNVLDIELYLPASANKKFISSFKARYYLLAFRGTT